ncbi:hypothetical protein [Paenibacillus solanacearum]|uniref:hypothetical protein n=1 Tax=Paenibacillus solanacearum TaxID=2048548 RepID=UPI001C4077B5|nr:hypothetical protein [Paenibacillus solanacearum]
MNAMPLQLRHDIPATAFWFIILAILSILLLAYTFWRKKDLKLVAFYLFMTTLAYMLDFVIFLCFRSYEYYPRIWDIPWYDQAFGTYLSQGFYVPVVAVFIAAFHLGFAWMVFFSVMFMGIEYLFIALGIYKLNWWNPVYTLVGVCIFFYIGKVWIKWLMQASSRLVRIITLQCASYGLQAHFFAVPLMFDLFRITCGFFSEPARDSLFTLILILQAQSLIIAVVCFYRFHWAILASIPLLLFGGELLLIHLSILHLEHFRGLYMLLAANIVAVVFCYYFNRILSDVRK